MDWIPEDWIPLDWVHLDWTPQDWIPHDWIPPSNFYWQGIYPVPGSSPAPAVVCSQVFPPLTIAPGQANGFFKLLTDFDLKQTAEGNPGAETITKTNLQSANAIISNTTDNSSVYINTTPFNQQLNLQPVRNVYIHNTDLGSFNTLGARGEQTIIKKYQ